METRGERLARREDSDGVGWRGGCGCRGSSMSAAAAAVLHLYVGHRSLLVPVRVSVQRTTEHKAGVVTVQSLAPPIRL